MFGIVSMNNEQFAALMTRLGYVLAENGTTWLSASLANIGK